MNKNDLIELGGLRPSRESDNYSFQLNTLIASSTVAKNVLIAVIVTGGCLTILSPASSLVIGIGFFGSNMIAGKIFTDVEEDLTTSYAC